MSKKIITLIFTLVLLGGSIFIYTRKPAQQDDVSVSQYTGSTVTINNHQFKVRIAQTTEELMKGLGGVEGLNADEGMLFIFPNAQQHKFWMDGMLFDLDFIWIRDGRVVDLTQNVSSSPERKFDIISPREPVNYVLEVPAGTIEREALMIGDEVIIKK